MIINKITIGLFGQEKERRVAKEKEKDNDDQQKAKA
mgnify:CR=1 FL=1